MAGGREIKTKIKSVQNTRKVTRALEMVSASKIRKAQDRMKASRPYARAMKQLIGHLAQANPDYRHPYLVQREDVKRVGYVVVSSDRGLAGGLNNNLFRKLLVEFRALAGAGRRSRRGHHRPEGVGVLPPDQGRHAGVGHPPRRRAEAGAADRRDQGDAGRLHATATIDKVFLVYNDFVNTMTQKATFDQLLPLPPAETQMAKHDWDYIYEPDARVRAGARADPLHRVAGVPGGAGERGLRACRAHGRDEGGERQRQQADRHPATSSTTRRARRRSPRKFPRSSAAPRRSDPHSCRSGTSRDRERSRRMPLLQSSIRES